MDKPSPRKRSVRNSAQEGLRGLLRSLPGPMNRNAYSPEEVRARLRLDPEADPRTAAVHAAAARTGEWAALLPSAVARDLGRAEARLPTIVFWYREGLPEDEIGRRLSPFGGAWDGDRAIAAASGLIAELLNRRRLEAGQSEHQRSGKASERLAEPTRDGAG